MIVRDAMVADLPVLVPLLGQLNEARNAPTAQHMRAFDEIEVDPRQHVLVVEDGRTIVGTAALTVIPNLGRDARPVALIENVVVDARCRGRGIGALLMREAIGRARAAGCYRVALMSRKHRTDAHRFYERLGFERTSEGFRLAL
jgi:GNAT superfamily N-acetyltransferase